MQSNANPPALQYVFNFPAKARLKKELKQLCVHEISFIINKNIKLFCVITMRAHSLKIVSSWLIKVIVRLMINYELMFCSPVI